MKIEKLIISAFLLLVFTSAYGQDKIITVQNDTMACYIINISLTHINFKLRNMSDAEGILIPMSEVREYSIGSQKKPKSHIENTSVRTLPVRSEKNLHSEKKQTKEPASRLRIGVQGGSSYVISTFANSRDQLKNMLLFQPSQVDEYYKKLRIGLHFGSDIHYFFSKLFGVGLKYSLLTSSTEMDFITQNIIVDDIPITYTTQIRDKIHLNYVGPSFVFRQWLSKSHKFRLNEELSFGYVNFKQEKRFNVDKYSVVNPDLIKTINGSIERGDTYGANLQLSFEYYPIPTLSMGLNAGFFATPIKSLKVTDGNTTVTETIDKKYHYNMTHANASIGVRLHF